MQHRLTIVFATALTCGCATTTDNRRSDNTVSFVLQAGQRNEGQTGRAFMTAQGDRTVLNLTITGVPPWVGRPVQLFTFVYPGSCGKLGANPAYALNDIVQAGLFSNSSAFGPFSMAKTIPTSVETLRTGNYALVLRSSPADGNVDIFCGDMK